MRNHSVPAAYVILLKEGRVLLSKRKNTGYMDGCYQLPAGHIEAGELPTTCACRELREEVGLEAKPEDLEFGLFVYRTRKDTTGDRADVFFTLKKWTGVISNPEPDKCGGWEWHPLEHLPAELIPYLREALGAMGEGRRFLEIA